MDLAEPILLCSNTERSLQMKLGTERKWTKCLIRYVGHDPHIWKPLVQTMAAIQRKNCILFPSKDKTFMHLKIHSHAYSVSNVWAPNPKEDYQVSQKQSPMILFFCSSPQIDATVLHTQAQKQAPLFPMGYIPRKAYPRLRRLGIVQLLSHI